MRAALGILALVALTGACQKQCTLSGTLTYLGTGNIDLTGRPFELRLDFDQDANTEPYGEFNSAWSNGTTHNYSFDISGYEGGRYYVYAEIPGPGYLVYGWYNSDPAQPFNPRDSVDVRCGMNLSFDIDAT